MTKALSTFTASLVATLNDIAGQPRDAAGFEGIQHSYLFTAEAGKVRDRVVVQSATHATGEAPDFTRAQRMVRCFVDNATGSILYAGGWATPAKWKSGPAIEFGGSEAEHVAYAEFTRDGGWGYKGDRKRWEDRKAEQV